MHTTTTRPLTPPVEGGSGWKWAPSTALGMTLTRPGATSARSTVFSLLVWDTHTTWLAAESVNWSTLLVRMLLASLNPNREWSVKTHGRPRAPACIAAWCARGEKAWWPWTTSTHSRTRTDRTREAVPYRPGSSGRVLPWRQG